MRQSFLLAAFSMLLLSTGCGTSPATTLIATTNKAPTTSVAFNHGFDYDRETNDKLDLFVNYTVVDVKTQAIWDIHRPYQASAR